MQWSRLQMLSMVMHAKALSKSRRTTQKWARMHCKQKQSVRLHDITQRDLELQSAAGAAGVPLGACRGGPSSHPQALTRVRLQVPPALVSTNYRRATIIPRKNTARAR